MKDLRAKWLWETRPKYGPRKPMIPVPVKEPPSPWRVKQSALERSRRHAKKDRVTEQDLPQLFRWLKPTSDEAGGRQSEGRHTPPSAPLAAPTWDALKQAIPVRLRAGHNRMRSDTKRLAKIESVTQKLVEALELGGSLDIAAAYAGIKPPELREWLALGHTRPKSVYAAFLGLIQSAIAQCDVGDLRAVTEAANRGEWKASIERLKLRGFGNQVDAEKKAVQVKIVNYNFNAPPQKVIAQTLDLDTLEYTKEAPRSIEYREEPDDLVEGRDDTDARGKTTPACLGASIFDAEGATPTDPAEKEVIK